jgi:heat shock protein HslJ
MPRRSLLLVAVLAAIPVAAGCGWNDSVDSRAATAGLPDARQLIQEHDWVLEPADSSLAGHDERVTLSVVDDDVFGTAPCNAYRGDFALGNDDSVEISDITRSQRDCGAATTQAEDEFLAALEAVDTVDVDEDGNDRLVLRGDDVRLTFVKHGDPGDS